MANVSTSDLTVIFSNITWSVNYIILPICFLMGNFGNCLNLIIFFQRISRSNSCLLYFFSASVVNIFILNFGLTLRILRGTWSIAPALKSLLFCRFRTYANSTFFLIYRLSILLASVDRMCASSRNVQIRQISQPKVAYRAIIFKWIFCLFYFISILLFRTIIYGQCLMPPNTIYESYATISALAQALLIPLGM
ncbi:hypothetical protein I4U23_000252 [Adineta vaga]|nr:hypothetical protein I4U23_000252 [Adineta vaga]